MTRNTKPRYTRNSDTGVYTADIMADLDGQTGDLTVEIGQHHINKQWTVEFVDFLEPQDYFPTLRAAREFVSMCIRDGFTRDERYGICIN